MIITDGLSEGLSHRLQNNGERKMSQDIPPSQIFEVIAKRYHTAFLWKYLWTALIFIIAIIMTVFITAALVLAFSALDLATAILNLIAGVASGAVLAFIIGQRNDAAKEENTAFETLLKWLDKDSKSAVMAEIGFNPFKMFRDLKS